MEYLLAHCPALTTPLPWMSSISFLGLVRASLLMKKKEIGSECLKFFCSHKHVDWLGTCC